VDQVQIPKITRDLPDNNHSSLHRANTSLSSHKCQCQSLAKCQCLTRKCQPCPCQRANKLHKHRHLRNQIIHLRASKTLHRPLLSTQSPPVSNQVLLRQTSAVCLISRTTNHHSLLVSSRGILLHKARWEECHTHNNNIHEEVLTQTQTSLKWVKL